MSVSQPSEDFPLRGKSGSTMILPLDGEEDHNGNAFPISSSSSSASSSSRMGESSPESLRSLSSLSGGRTNSPLDYDMFEVTVVATVTTQPDKTTGVDDISVGKIQTATELTESNDNSVSVYLDANSEYQQDPWNDNDNENVTLALSLNMNSGGHSVHDDLSSGSANERRPGSSCPDSDATEIPGDDDDDDDEEEVLFLSVSSDMGVCKSSMTLISLAGQSSGESVVTTELQTEGSVPVSAADEDEGSEALLEAPDVPSKVNQTEALASDDPTKATQISSSPPRSAHDAKGVTSPPPEGAKRCAMDSEPQSSQQDRASKAESPPVTSLASKTGVFTPSQTSSQEAKKASRLDPKLAQSKAGSRPTRSPSKTPTQVSQIYDRVYMCQVINSLLTFIFLLLGRANLLQPTGEEQFRERKTHRSDHQQVQSKWSRC